MQQNKMDEKDTGAGNSGKGEIGDCPQITPGAGNSGRGEICDYPRNSRGCHRDYLYTLFFILSISLTVVAMRYMDLRSGRGLMYVFWCIFVLHGYIFIKLTVRILADKKIIQHHLLIHYFPIINAIWFYRTIPQIAESCKVIAKQEHEPSIFTPSEKSRKIRYLIIECYILSFAQFSVFILSIIYGYASVAKFEYVINAVLLLYSWLSIGIIYNMYDLTK